MSLVPTQYPATRLRRLRASAWSRSMHSENVLTPADFIWPLFVTGGKGVKEAVQSMPGVFRWSVDLIVEQAKLAHSLGIPCLALFPNTDIAKRSEDGREAWNADNLMCQAIRAIKDAVPDIGLLTDVALDPYTSHGHDGVIDAQGYVLNDETKELLIKQARVQAEAGADIIAPSDMMDGRIAAIRDMLESEGHRNVQIMSYAAKYASVFYNPFRDAVGSAGIFKADKKTYQMDPANSDEALREVAMDIAEGADSVMVKPGLPYLDVLYRVKESFKLPVFAYQVSGEYAMLEAAFAAGMLDKDKAVLETLTCFKRAGAAGVLTYHAVHAAKLLNG
ncbi:MAG: porphobilinogen synthase [Zymomonas mobilis]|uniref:porphobilinogen synthase n=1 Tax=Zymomonas mobilis TaxID=542 RepID=UPI0039EC8C07